MRSVHPHKSTLVWCKSALALVVVVSAQRRAGHPFCAVRADSGELLRVRTTCAASVAAVNVSPCNCKGLAFFRELESDRLFKT